MKFVKVVTFAAALLATGGVLSACGADKDTN